MTDVRVQRSRPTTRREEEILARAREEAGQFDNRLFGEMYVEALERKLYQDDPSLYEFMFHLEQPPVDIETFLDHDEFLGSTDLSLWPEVRKAIVDINQHWWRGVAGGGNHEALLMGATGTGKCLAKGTPVLLYDGTVIPVEDVRVGDALMGPDSTPRSVLSLASGREEMFKVTPTNGDSYIVNRSHILSLKVTGMGANKGREKTVLAGDGRRYYAGDIVDISIDDYLASSATFRHVAKGWRTGVTFGCDNKLNIDPYFVGLWLGDGTSRDVSITTQDAEVVAYLRGYAGRLGLKLADYTYGDRCMTVGLTCTMRGQYNTLRSRMQGHGLLNSDKFIPHAFLTASEYDRLSLLAGLVDSDGHLSCGGYEIVTKLRGLADDIAFLARSLGFAVSVNPATKASQNGTTGTYCRVFISGNVSRIPVLLDRKRATPRRQKKDVLLTGITVESVGEGEYYGFEIDGDRRFLLGDFTVTHNTEIGKITLAYQMHILGCIRQPQTVYGLPKTTSIVFPIMAAKPHVTRKVVYLPLRKMIEEMPWFQKHLRFNKLIESEMYFEDKNLRIVMGGADADSILGEAVIGGIIDEINFMNVVLKSKKAEVASGRAGLYDQAQTIYESMTRRKKGRFISKGPMIGVVCVSSSTKYKGDFTDKRYEHVQKHNEKGVYIYNKKQYEVWPQERYSGSTFKLLVGNDILSDTRVLGENEEMPEGSLVLDVPVEYLDDFRKNPHDSLRDIVGMSTNSISPFFKRRFKIYDCISAGEEDGLQSFLEKDNVILGVDGMPVVKRGHYCTNPSRPRYVHIDLSLTGDRCGIAMVRFDGLRRVESANGLIEFLPEATVELACTIEPDAQNEIQIAEIRTWVKQLRDVYGYPVKVVTYDGYHSRESIQQWRKAGMKTGNVSVDKTSVPYKQLKDAINDARIRMFHQEVLVSELFELEYDVVKDKVDHPPKGGKDLADAVCGAYTTLLERRSSWTQTTDVEAVASERKAYGDRYESERFV